MRIAILASCFFGLASCGSVRSGDEGDSDADTDVDADTDADTDADSDADSDTDADTDTDTDADSDTGSGTSSGSDTGSDTSSIDGCAGLGGACDDTCDDLFDCAIDLGGNQICLRADRSQCSYDTDCAASWSCLERKDGKGGFCISPEDRTVICDCAAGPVFFYC